jgi:hypothetical protein
MAVQTWDGTVRRGALSAWAGRARDDLAAAAKRYDWMTVFDLIRQQPHFVNSVRPDGTAWFAPLHQVAHGGASAEVANRLIAEGAWRSLRTSTGERPSDIARDRGHDHLLDALKPPRRTEVAPDVLATIQDRFHEVIRGRMREFRIEDDLRLPELEVLLELPQPELWFPLPGMYGGFRFRLAVRGTDVRLISDSWCRVVGGSEERHEITESGARAVSQQG